MTTQGETTAADEPLDPSQMYSGISMANDRINALQTESPKIKLVKYKTYFFYLFFEISNNNFYREWREKNTQRIEDADKKEETDGASWKEQAKIQKDEFYKWVYDSIKLIHGLNLQSQIRHLHAIIQIGAKESLY